MHLKSTTSVEENSAVHRTRRRTTITQPQSSCTTISPQLTQSQMQQAGITPCHAICTHGIERPLRSDERLFTLYCLRLNQIEPAAGYLHLAVFPIERNTHHHHPTPTAAYYSCTVIRTLALRSSMNITLDMTSLTAGNHSSRITRRFFCRSRVRLRSARRGIPCTSQARTPPRVQLHPKDLGGRIRQQG